MIQNNDIFRFLYLNSSVTAALIGKFNCPSLSVFLYCILEVIQVLNVDHRENDTLSPLMDEY